MKTMIDFKGPQTHEEVKTLTCFLSDYASSLLACGATTIRIEKNVSRIAEAYHSEVQLSVLPTHIILAIWDKQQEHSYSTIGKTKGNAINFFTNTYLSKLSWEMHDGKLTWDEAMVKYNVILNHSRINFYVVLILVGFANASFCRLFGGDAISMLIVFIATVDGFYLKHKLLQWHWDARLVTILSACISAVIACSGYIFGWGNTPDLALGTSVLYLVPGIPFINSISDLINGHHICFLSRFIQAIILTICLSLGLCIGLACMHINIF